MIAGLDRMNRSKGARAADWILVAAAVLVTVRAYVPRPTENRIIEASDSIPVKAQHWRGAVETGLQLAGAAHRDTLVEFVDFECPFCRVFAAQVDSAFDERDVPVTRIFQHYPLPPHRFAKLAAVASECAERQGRFKAMYRVLFAKQDSLGLKDWTDLAYDAGVPDTLEFNRCHGLPIDSFPRITAGLQLATAAGLKGTPTVWMNGATRLWRPMVEHVRKVSRPK